MNEITTVFCQKYKCTMKALEKAPIKGPIGEVIHKNSSLDAWQEWLEVQIKIINEERLDLSEERAVTRLYEAMIAFLGLEETITR